MTVNLDPNNRQETKTTLNAPKSPSPICNVVERCFFLINQGQVLEEESYKGYCLKKQLGLGKNLSNEERDTELNACIIEQRKFLLFLEDLNRC
ncbi:MAG: hypothetical protein H0W50_04150 [Parachlamydiaceae bacterium]|nr:hypothetical protein [Parachlamydiaceae bacterium]